ncbi:hypothetical protein D3C72_2005380 [compost metagenome]
MVVGGVGLFKGGTRGLGDGFVAADQQADHFQRFRHRFRFGNGRQLGILAVSAGRVVAQGADAFGDAVQRGPLFRVLRHEHLVQRVEHGPRDVPVEVVRHQVQRVRVGKQLGQFAGDGGAVLVRNADVDARGAARGLLGGLGHC